MSANSPTMQRGKVHRGSRLVFSSRLCFHPENVDLFNFNDVILADARTGSEKFLGADPCGGATPAHPLAGNGRSEPGSSSAVGGLRTKTGAAAAVAHTVTFSRWRTCLQSKQRRAEKGSRQQAALITARSHAHARTHMHAGRQASVLTWFPIVSVSPC